MPDLSISIVSYKTRELLIACLRSVYKNTHKVSFEIFVVDNNSQDNAVESIKREFPDVNLISNETNAGFAKANNSAIRRSKGDFILLLNPDTIVLPGSLDIMVDYIKRHSDIGALGCRILNPDRSLQITCSGFPAFLTLLIESTILRAFFSKSKILQKYRISDWNRDTIRDVDAVSGSCIMVRKDAIVQAGELDEYFFMYFEEIDWCYRIKHKGYRICFIPDAQIIHYECGSTSQDNKARQGQIYRQSASYYIRKHHGLCKYLLLELCLFLSLCFCKFSSYITGKNNVY